MLIHTASGSTYVVRGDTIARLADEPIVRDPFGAPCWVARLVPDTADPEVGRSWSFLTEHGAVTTSPVTAVDWTDGPA